MSAYHPAVTSYSPSLPDERHGLAAALERAGPDAPTLCAGWTTHDLAAHVVVRERRPDSGPGLLLSPLSGYTDRVRTRVADRHSYAELVELIRSGPPRWSPFALPRLDRAANAVEFFVHHEDVRRARDGWTPRQLGDAFEEALWRRLKGSTRFLLRRLPVGLVLSRPDGLTTTGRSGTPAVTLHGPPSELLLYLLGRRSVARVEMRGDAESKRALAGARLGL